MEQVPFLGRKGIEGRVVCGVWERRREGEGEEEEREKRKGKERISLSIPIHKLPCGADPSWDSPTILQTLSKHTTTQPPSMEPRPKNGGSPASSPPGEREEKEGEKDTFYTYYPQFFSLGENPQTPPSNWDAQEKDKKSEGAR